MNTVPFRLNRRLRQRRAKRIDPLATLPVFLRLQGRRAVVVGGSDAAAWKAELLAAAGAEVEVYAASPCAALHELIQDPGTNGSVRIENRRWDRRVLAGASLAIGDFSCVSGARAFCHACRQGGVPVNVIDRPDYCDFQFGSIVNRGPVVVGVSTDGAAPILGQAIRRRIESQLPGFLADWARIARDARAEVNRMLTPGRQRRLFWERFVDRAFAGPTDGSSLQSVLHSCHETADESPTAGRLFLLEAPCDDVELLTLKAVRILQMADFVVYCSTVPTSVLELARREATRVAIGSDVPPADVKAWMTAGKTVVLVSTGNKTTVEFERFLHSASVDFTRI